MMSFLGVKHDLNKLTFQHHCNISYSFLSTCKNSNNKLDSYFFFLFAFNLNTFKAFREFPPALKGFQHSQIWFGEICRYPECVQWKLGVGVIVYKCSCAYLCCLHCRYFQVYFCYYWCVFVCVRKCLRWFLVTFWCFLMCEMWCVSLENIRGWRFLLRL